MHTWTVLTSSIGWMQVVAYMMYMNSGDLCFARDVDVVMEGLVRVCSLCGLSKTPVLLFWALSFNPNTFDTLNGVSHHMVKRCMKVECICRECSKKHFPNIQLPPLARP